MVTETPEIYRDSIRPYMSAKREEGRLNWVFNILEGRTEQEDVILRDKGHDGNEEGGFLVLPDLNWDRKTMGSLHLLALVMRRDIWSLRDLKKKHIPWLKYLRERLLEDTIRVYPQLETDQLKLYVHCKTPFLVLCVWRCLITDLDVSYRSTDVLSFPCAHCERHARGGCNSGDWKGVRVGEHHLAVGDTGWRRRGWNGGCQLDLFPG